MSFCGFVYFFSCGSFLRRSIDLDNEVWSGCPPNVVTYFQAAELLYFLHFYSIQSSGSFSRITCDVSTRKRH